MARAASCASRSGPCSGRCAASRCSVSSWRSMRPWQARSMPRGSSKEGAPGSPKRSAMVGIVGWVVPGRRTARGIVPGRRAMLGRGSGAALPSRHPARPVTSHASPSNDSRRAPLARRGDPRTRLPRPRSAHARAGTGFRAARDDAGLHRRLSRALPSPEGGRVAVRAAAPAPSAGRAAARPPRGPARRGRAQDRRSSRRRSRRGATRRATPAARPLRGRTSPHGWMRMPRSIGSTCDRRSSR